MKERNIFSTAMIKTDTFLKKMLLDDDNKTTNEQLAEAVAIKIMLKKDLSEEDYKLIGILKIKYGIDVEHLFELILNND